MRMRNLKNWLGLTLLWLIPFCVEAQHEDCRTAYIICSDSSFNFLPTGRGIDDFENPNNDEGCLLTRENISAWFYFELREDMPIDSNQLGFLIIDTLPNYFIDYDFAIYGPNLNCDSLGSPYRCSFARLPNNGNLGIGSVVSTGFKANETDTTESFTSTDGFLKPMNVKPGDGFFLVIDFFVSAFPGGNLEEFDSTAVQGFKFIWGGSAAPWLNCIANPNCDQVTVDVGVDQDLCAGESLQLNTAVTNTAGRESYIWSEINGRTSFLSNPNIPNPILNIPVGFSGILEYTVLVKEGACEHTDQIRITVQDGGEPTITGDNIVCEGETADLMAEAGFATYTWSTGETTPNITVAGGQTYRLTVTSAGNANCPGVGEFTVVESKALRPFIRGNANLCTEGRQSTILRGPDGFNTYFWDNGIDTSTNAFFTLDTATQVILTVTDSIGCPSTDTAEVVRLPDPIPEIIGDTIICEGTTEVLRVGVGFATFTWSGAGAGITDTLLISAPGTYNLEVEDTLGCIGRNSITLNERANPTPSITGDFTFCSNESTTISGPDNFTYLWSTGETTQSINIDTAGSVALLVTDSFGCEGSTNANLDTLPLPRPIISGFDYICEGGSTTLDAGVFDAYIWSTGDTSASIDVDQAIVYMVTVTDNNGCLGSGDLSVNQRINPIPTITGDSILCPGETTLLMSTNDFTTYNWSTGSNSDTTSFDMAGIVSLSVVDSFGCPGTNTYEIDTLASPVPQITGDTAFCEGETGLLMGEAGFVSYEWPDGSMGQNFQVDTGGIITLIVVDNNGCRGANDILVNERSAPIPTVTGDVNFCANESGLIAAPPGFVTYNWSSGQSTRSIEVFDPGNFQVTVVDDVGCSGSAQITVDTVSIPQPAILGGDYVCETGTRLLFATSHETYEWSTGDSTGATLITSPGIYSLTVTDINGCTNSTLTSIRLQPDPQPQIQGDPILCPGESTTLSTRLSYDTYDWSTGATSASIQTTFLSQVSVIVRDTFGCEGVDTIQLQNVPNPTVSIAGQLDICDGEGAILSATEGFVTYLWSNGSDSVSTIGRVNGLFTVTVTDNNGCQAEASSNLTVNDNPKPNIQGTLNICEGEIATLSIRENFLAYDWSTGDTTSFIQVRESGSYIINVSSPGGCTNADTAFVTVFEPRISPLNNAVLDICEGDSLILDGGDNFLSYLWSTGQTSQSIEINNGGDFLLSVVDTNGCRTSSNIRVRQQSNPVPNIIAPEVFCKGTPVSILAGGTFRTYEWSNGASGDIIEITEGGRYELTVTDNNGCVGTLAVDLEERESPEVEIAGDLLICVGDTTTLTIPDEFLYVIWTDDTNDTSVVVTEPGGYGVLVLSDNGCTGADEVQVLFREDPLPLITGDIIKCSNEIGTLDAGSGFVSYEWERGDTTQQIQIDSAGTFEVLVTDDFGCDNIARVIVQEVIAPTVSFTGPPGICPGETVSVSVDSSFSMINWSTGETTSTININAPGIYTVQVADTSSCIGIDSIELAQFQNPDFNLLGDTVICEGTTTRIRLDRIFPVIAWSTGDSTTSVTVDTTGLFSVMVENMDGCEGTQSQFVMMNPAPPAFAGPNGAIDCFSDSLQLGLANSAYPPNIQPVWTGPGITFDNELLFQPVIADAGIYTIRTTDTLTGCLSDRQEVFVEDIRYTPTASITSDGAVDCISGTAMIDGTLSQMGPVFRYEWTAGPTDSLFANDILNVMVDQALEYKLFVIDTVTGCIGVDSLELVFDAELPSAVIGPADILSCSVPTQTLNASPAPPGSNWSFNWINAANPNDSTLIQDLVVNQPGSYILIVENLRNGCTDIDSVEVIRNDILPDISAGPDLELDCNIPDVQLGEPFAEDRWIVTWSKANEPDFVTAQKRPIVSEAGEYRLEVLDPINGCISYDTAVITIYEDRPTLVDLNINPEQCFGENNGQINITNVVGGEGPYLFRLANGAFNAQNSISGVAPGRYTLTIQDIRGCELDTILSVDQGTDPFLELGPDRYIVQGEYVRLSALTNIADVAIQDLRWTQPDTLTCDTCQVLRLAPQKTVEFIATVVDTNGCRATDSVFVFVDRTKRVFIPNAFSPNGDGFNDRITVFSSSNVRNVLTFQIYDRGGDMVFNRMNFSPNDLSLGWDGFHRGRLMNSQTLVYYAEVEFDDGEILKFEGGIHLVR